MVTNDDFTWPDAVAVSFYYKRTEASVYSYAGFFGGGNSGNDINDLIRSDSNLIFTTSTGNDWKFSYAWSDYLSDYNWWHVVVVTDYSTYANLYLNDTLIAGTASGTPAKSGGDYLIIGNRDDSNKQSCGGIIDEFRVFNRALSADEISSLYKLDQIKMGMSLTDKATNGLVGMWSFDGADISNSGTTALDRSGNANDGTISGATPTMGKRGQAMSFDGTNDYVNMGDVLDMGTNDMTVSAWVKVEGTTDLFPIIFKGAANSENTGYNFYYSPSSPYTDQIVADISDGSSRVEANSNTISIEDGSWHHLLVIFDRDSSAYFYVDGISAGSESISSFSGTSIAGSENLEIGRWFGGSYNADGSIDEARIYNRALSASEVLDLYNLGKVKLKN